MDPSWRWNGICWEHKCPSNHPLLGYFAAYTGVDWVICGGETGPGARPMHPEWVRSARDQCRDAGVPFFFKQWGEWNPDNKGICRGIRTQKLEGVVLYRIGKKAAGRSLDGEAWDEMPEGRMNYKPF
jgi:protein gp37